MWTSSDRRVGEVIKLLEHDKEKEKAQKLQDLAKKHFDLTLEKLWPLKSNENPS